MSYLLIYHICSQSYVYNKIILHQIMLHIFYKSKEMHSAWINESGFFADPCCSLWRWPSLWALRLAQPEDDSSWVLVSQKHPGKFIWNPKIWRFGSNFKWLSFSCLGDFFSFHWFSGGVHVSSFEPLFAESRRPKKFPHLGGQIVPVMWMDFCSRSCVVRSLFGVNPSWGGWKIHCEF